MGQCDGGAGVFKDGFAGLWTSRSTRAKRGSLQVTRPRLERLHARANRRHRPRLMQIAQFPAAGLCVRLPSAEAAAQPSVDPDINRLLIAWLSRWSRNFRSIRSFP